MEESRNPWEVFKKVGINVYDGIIIEMCPSDIGILNPEDFIEYCTLNNIKAVFLQYEFKEEETLDFEQIRIKLTNFFNNQFKKFPFSEEFLPKHITKDFFASALELSLNELAKESVFSLPKSKEEVKNEETDDVILIEAWAIHSGCRIHTTVYEKEEEKDSITEKDILDKYAMVIKQRLDTLRNEAQAESNRIEKENEKKVLDEIWNVICNSNEVIRMNTQKARNEFADRIQILYQEEKGCDWLTKKQVRSLVEYRYTKLTE